MQSFWLPISESEVTYFLAADFLIGSDTVFGNQFLNRHRHSLAADF
jgi:hypothetical protein